MKWKEIKCKECKTQEGRMFMFQPPKSADDVYCEKCHKAEIEKRAK